MFDYPHKAEINRPLPKSTIYRFAKPSPAVRARFISEISSIIWKYKLSPETVNLPSRQGIEEIQVFVVALKAGELSGAALRPILLAIDKAIPSPILFQLTSGDRIKFAAAWKRPSEADASRSVIDATYFETTWQRAPVTLPRLPVALDLAGLYDLILRRHIAVPARPRESLNDHIERVGQIRIKKTECRRLDARLLTELQFNRKVEINATLRLRQTELAQLQQS